MSLKNTFCLAGWISSRVIGGLILFGCVAVARAQAADSSPQPQFVGLAAGLPQVSLTLISLTPLIVNGQTVGAMALYDDPTTHRPADYVEVFDSEGAPVIVSWFDRFGIERLVVDRALIEGGDELQGVFVAVLDGESI